MPRWKDDVKGVSWKMIQTPEGESKPPYIRKAPGEAPFYICYRDGRYLDVVDTLEEAQATCIKGHDRVARRDGIKHLKAYLDSTPTPNLIPPFIAITDTERGALRKIHPELGDAPSDVPLAQGGMAFEVGVGIIGKIAEYGPEVCGIRFPGETSIRYISNGKLVGTSAPMRKVEAVDKPAKVKAAIKETPQGTIERIRDGNPKKAGTGAFDRWELLFAHSGKSVADFLAADGNPTTLKNAVVMGFVKINGA